MSGECAARELSLRRGVPLGVPCVGKGFLFAGSRYVFGRSPAILWAAPSAQM
ncbi:hypothetical protein HDA41_007355 [Streptomyces caelestis]|jgi:hypothetical protein|uniref:Uncharacterized protein n=1 Tax=Streptomyces caelestis TaxID=36816 RepID=A0A7W9LX56_9ACTN|nr:hypothetical protein [Streptomyces caelestis]